MGDERRDLARLAGEYAEQGIDLYELLGVDALTAKEDIHRAWRKRSLRYHPDKAGAHFDGAKWELFERARDVLADADARAAYDGVLKARLLRLQERAAMDHERQRFADDLEAREQAALRLRQQRARQQRDSLDQERRRLAEAQRVRLAEAQRVRLAEQARQAEAAQELADLEEARRRLREKRDDKARRKLARDSIKASVGLPRPGGTGPANGVVDVPGHYRVDLGDASKTYWELVCDKLRAVQAARNLHKSSPTAEQLRVAHETVDEARRKISEAEARYQREAEAGR